MNVPKLYMEERVNINVSATNYDESSDGIRSILANVEEMVHEENEFRITDSEFAFGWHFYVVSINRMLIQKLADQLGDDFQKLKGKSLEKKFLKWFSQKIQEKNVKAKLAIKEEMESSKYGIF
ncbi:hypothetical protein AAA799D07_00279 [Marine Group I thaumarchaeote SCGC AAA799-D07]|nr:hypothetical protein AAA799D07_00279 [Marine Group I thaumarchaeote SCGC AAA799-D07]